MDELREKVRGFIAEFANPDEKDIQKFISDLALQNPSLDSENFKKNLAKLVKNAKELAAYEKQYSLLDEKSPGYTELAEVLKEARTGQENLEDISDELKIAKKILKSASFGKTRKKPAGDEAGKKKSTPEKGGAVLTGHEKEPRESEEPAGKIEPGEEDKTVKKSKRKEIKPEAKPEKERLPEEVESLMHHLDSEATKDIIKEKMTPEKQAAFLHLEEKLLSDVETGIKKLKDVPFEKSDEPLLARLKSYLTKETEDIETYHQSLHGELVTFEGMEGYKEIERYWVNEPYSFVVILFNPEKNSYLYYVAEPKLSDFEDLLLKEIKDRLKDILLFEDVKMDEDKEKILTDKVRKVIKDYAIDITPLTLEKILYYTRRDFIKFGKIDPLMHDNGIEDISANGFDIPIYLYHKKYTNMPTNIFFTESELDSYVIRLAQRCGKHVSVAEPMVDATMPDGSRIQMTLGTEVTTHGATFTIRKFSEVPITPVDLINWNTFSAEEMAYLWLCIENNKSLIFAGGTASGKTSSLNAVSLFIPWQAKIISLEDTRELKLPHPNWIPGITRDSFTADGRGSIDMYDLLRAALRQRPEYLLVGEVRGKEALTLFQAMSTGHTTFSTMHADSVSSAIHRLENPPISVPRSMIQALNIISIQAQTFVKGKRARRNMKLVEITDIDPTTRNIRTNDIFAWDALTDKFHRVGESIALNEVMIRRGWNIGDLKKELSNRQEILEFLINNKISDFYAIATIIHDYQVTPDKVLKKLNISG